MSGMGVRVGVSALSQRGSGFAGSARPLPQGAQQPAGGARSAVTMMASKSKDIRLFITLECTEQKATGVAGISRYMTEKNRRNTPGRLELMKFNKYLRKMTLHREIKK